MQRRKGFTLIELLVVIAIIAILAAILFPVFSNVQEKGRQTKCMNNMKQLATALMMYVDNNNGFLPAPWDGGRWDEGTWKQRLRMYLKSYDVLNCTNKTYGHQPPQNQLTMARQSNPFDHYGIAVGLTHRNVVTSGFLIPYGYFGFARLSAVQLQSKTIMVAENDDGDWSVEPMTDYGNYWGGDGGFYPYHMRRSRDKEDKNGGGNFIFCDGHAKFMTVDASEGFNPATGKRDFFYWIADRSFNLPPL